MIALNYQPFSTVSNVGFAHLLHSLELRYALPSRKYITETVIPTIYENVKADVVVQIADVPHTSFTSYLWSTTVSVNSLTSLTAHWLTEEFERKRAVLQVCLKVDKMFKEWKTEED